MDRILKVKYYSTSTASAYPEFNCDIGPAHAGHAWIADVCVWRVRYGSWALWLIVLTLFILIGLCGLLAGLTLAICSLNMTYLHIMSTTGEEKTRKMARAVMRLRKHSTWLLCSLVILSVICNEAVPIVLASIWIHPWKCATVSTVLLVFFGELVPQILVPRHALEMGYLFRSLIWFTMWATLPLSWPISWCFRRFLTPTPVTAKSQRLILREDGMYNAEQLIEFLKYHEKSKKHGGLSGPDATKIACGALQADYHKIGGGYNGPQRSPGIKLMRRQGREVVDLEKGSEDLAERKGIIISWSKVKTIDYNEIVDDDFVLKIQSWAYSRIPVVETLEETDHFGHSRVKLRGYLHIRNLVGLKIVEDMKVKDLDLYKMPIVLPSMTIYELLNYFQIGISQIVAIRTVHTKDRDVPRNGDTLPRYGAPTQFDPAASENIEMMTVRRHVSWSERVDSSEPGIDPMPMGIITYQDVVDEILQKRSCDEADFWGPAHGLSQDKDSEQQSDQNQGAPQIPSDTANISGESISGPRRSLSGENKNVESSEGVVRSKKGKEPAIDGTERADFQKIGVPDSGTLRRRAVYGDILEDVADSPTGRNFDGTNDNWAMGLDGANESVVRIKDFGAQLDNSFDLNDEAGDQNDDALIEEVNRRGSSSYTSNSQGGWHSKVPGDGLGTTSVVSLFPSGLSPDDLRLSDPAMTPTPESDNGRISRTVSMPSVASDKTQRGMIQAITRYASARLPKLRRVEAFVRDEAGNLTTRDSENIHSADYAVKPISSALTTEKFQNKKRGSASQKHSHHVPSFSQNSSNKENLAPESAIKSLAKLVKNRLQMTTDSGDTISLTPTSCYGDLEGADIMAESYMTRRSNQTLRPSLEIAPLFASIIDRYNPKASGEDSGNSSEVELTMPSVYVGMGTYNSYTLPRNFGGTVFKKKLAKLDAGAGFGEAKRSFEFGDDRAGLPSQRVEGVMTMDGKRRTGSSPWWL